jgi:hypothetical protein
MENEIVFENLITKRYGDFLILLKKGPKDI